MRWNVSHMKNVYAMKSWVDISCADVVSNSSIMHVMNQEKNIESIDLWELKEHWWQWKNIIIRKIMEESIETHASLRKAIGEFFSMHHGMLDVNVYGGHRVRKHVKVKRDVSRMSYWEMTFSKQDCSRDESRDTQIFGVPNRLDWYTRKKVIILVNLTKKEVWSHYKSRCPLPMNNVFIYMNNYLICELRAFTPNNLPLKGPMWTFK